MERQIMKPYQITALSMGTTTVPCAEIYWMTKLHGWEPLTFWAFLIQNEERRILLNTGFPSDISALQTHWTTWAKAATGEEGHVPVVQPEHRLTAALAKQGLKPDDITDVLITPLTAYATGGLKEMSKANLWFSHRGWMDFHAPDPEIPQLPRHIIFPDDVLTYLVTEAASRLRFLPDETQEFLPGIHSWFCGAHHRSSMAFVVNTAKGRVGLTDAIFKYRNYEENIPLGLSESIEEHHRLFARFRRETDLILPLYDPALIERHPNLTI
jgi:hypothetical protein